MTTDNLITPSVGTDTPIDRDKLKIASFRTKEGVWADFTAAANRVGLTATDVIKAAMEQFIAGEYIPSIRTGIHTTVSTPVDITRDEIQELIDTAVSTAVSMAIDTNINTSVSTETIEANIMTVISTLSLPTNKDVSTAIDTALVPLRDEISSLSEFSRNLQGEIAKLKQARFDRVESSKTIEVAPTPARKSSEALDLETDTDATWVTFHKAVGLETPSKKSLELANTAISKATELGFTGWTYNSKKQTFHRNSP
jgi:antitoxin component of RelBE/YafQ-DinJ toxin-antitoxin module